MHEAIWEAALDGDLRAIDRVLRIMEHRAKLLGLEAPRRTGVATMDAIDKEIRELTAELQRRGVDAE